MGVLFLKMQASQDAGEICAKAIEVFMTANDKGLSDIQIWVAIASLMVVAIGTVIAGLQTRRTRMQGQTLGLKERLIAANDFILTIETDRESLEARQKFGRIRDTHKTSESRAEYKWIFNLALKKDPTGKGVKKRTDIEKKEHDEFYRILLRHLNIMEMMAVGIRSGAYDEGTLKTWKRKGLINDACVVQDAVEVVRETSENNKLYHECVWLASRWYEETDGAQLKLKPELFIPTAKTDKTGADISIPEESGYWKKLWLAFLGDI